MCCKRKEGPVIITCDMTIQERKQAIKALFKGYRRMSRSMEKELESLGIQVERTKNHVKLYCDGRLYTAPSSASDWRSGANLASIICREM